MPDAKSPAEILRENWGKASRTTLTASAVLFILSRGQKATPSELLKAFGLDWTALNPYAIGLFGVPVIAALCLWTLWWARTYALSRRSSTAWYERVATKTDLSQVGEEARTLAGWSLVLYVLLPIVALAALEGKFLNGTFSFSITNEYSCLPDRSPQNCLPQGSGLAHFWPPSRLQSIWGYTLPLRGKPHVPSAVAGADLGRFGLRRARLRSPLLPADLCRQARR